MTAPLSSSSLPTSDSSGGGGGGDGRTNFSFTKPPIFLLKTKSSPTDGYEEYFRRTSTSDCSGNGSDSGSGSFSSSGYEPIFIPVLEHRFNAANLQRLKEYFVTEGAFLDDQSPAKGEKGRNGRRRYGGLIFTSQRAVEGFAKVLVDEVGVPTASAASHSLILYAVGPATSRALKAIRDTHLPHAQIYGDEAGTGEKLAHMILEHYNGLYKGTTTAGYDDNDNATKPALLFLVGEQRRDIIPRTLMSESLPRQDRIQVDELVLYETGEMASFESEFRTAVEAGDRFLVHRRRRQQQQGQDDEKHVQEGEDDDDDDDDDEVMWTVVFSPTGCDAMLRTLNLLPSPNDHNNDDDDDNHKSNNHNSSMNNINNDNRGNTTRTTTRRRRRCFIVTIGPTTRDHLRSKYSFEPDVCAEKPSPEGVGRGIEAFMEARRSRSRRRNKQEGE
ncbi:hypothetical protein VTN77DRAFT_7558 [Rasamsonia byssochlamydoides]|uniref:uncharacterized protein n=1 Tax=Rasamsonia byssochlamydoides TaxID=89139 RepID=UPI0037431C48